MTASKKKITISISEDLLGAIDDEAAATETARSALMEKWLYRSLHARKKEDLHAQTRRYYKERTPDERLEDEDWSAFSSAAFAARKG